LRQFWPPILRVHRLFPRCNRAPTGNVAEPITDPEELVLGSVGLDEIEVPMPSDGEIPESELSEIDKELSSDDDLDDEEEEEETEPEPEPEPEPEQKPKRGRRK